jgi:hypothetical protein
MEETTDIQAHIEPQTVEKPKFQRVVEGVLRLLGLDGFVSYVHVLKNVFVVMLIAFLGVVEIFNTHLAERLTRKIIAKKQHIKELRWEYMAENAEKNRRTKQSEIQKIVAPGEIKPLQEPPKKIEIER